MIFDFENIHNWEVIDCTVGPEVINVTFRYPGAVNIFLREGQFYGYYSTIHGSVLNSDCNIIHGQDKLKQLWEDLHVIAKKFVGEKC